MREGGKEKKGWVGRREGRKRNDEGERERGRERKIERVRELERGRKEEEIKGGDACYHCYETLCYETLCHSKTSCRTLICFYNSVLTLSNFNCCHNHRPITTNYIP